MSTDSDIMIKAGLAGLSSRQQATIQPPSTQSGANTPHDLPAVPHNDSVQIQSTGISRSLDTVQAIKLMHAKLNQAAMGVRGTAEALGKANEQIGQLKGSLETVTKNFPPYPVDSAERKKALMEYSALRKVFLQLMVPPPPPEPYEKVKHLWNSLFDGEGRMSPESVPAVDDSSKDATLNDAVTTLDATGAKLADLGEQISKALVS